MKPLPKLLLAIQKRAEECRFQEEREDSFHRESLPITAPVLLENADQLVPNWNSIGIPVTTPTTKFIPKMRAQKRAAWL